jgi:peptide/nickel transport system permease protein
MAEQTLRIMGKGGKIVKLMKKLKTNPKGFLGFIILLVYVGMALFADIISTHDPNEIVPEDRLLPPSFKHFFGTDQYGRDIFSRVVHGSRISIYVGSLSSLIALVLGTTMGLLAGYYRGYIDEVISRFIDVLLAFPALLLAILIAAILGPNLFNLCVIIGVVYMPQFTRIVRASVLSLREKEFVLAARAAGDRDFTVMFSEILPNAIAPLIVQTSITFAFAILTEASLSFLGLGIPPPTPAWGSMLYDARGYIEFAPWMTIAPGMAIFLAVFGFNTFGDGLRDILDPRLKVD